jgi:hypothetical protein
MPEYHHTSHDRGFHNSHERLLQQTASNIQSPHPILKHLCAYYKQAMAQWYTATMTTVNNIHPTYQGVAWALGQQTIKLFLTKSRHMPKKTHAHKNTKATNHSKTQTQKAIHPYLQNT